MATSHPEGERPNTAATRRWMMNSKVLDESIAVRRR